MVLPLRPHIYNNRQQLPGVTLDKYKHKKGMTFPPSPLFFSFLISSICRKSRFFIEEKWFLEEERILKEERVEPREEEWIEGRT
jgi:hypothetical protein